MTDILSNADWMEKHPTAVSELKTVARGLMEQTSRHQANWITRVVTRCTSQVPTDEEMNNALKLAKVLVASWDLEAMRMQTFEKVEQFRSSINGQEEQYEPSKDSIISD
jgi:RecB family exonuclease